MNKKVYQKPAVQVVAVKAQQLLQQASAGAVKTVGGGVFSSEVSAGSGGARSRGFDDWDDEE